jgi:hypothetical protein
MQSVVYRSSTLYATHTVFLPASTPTRSAVQIWSGINPSAPAPTLCRIDDSTATYFRAYPSLAVNADGDMLVGYSRFASTEYASAAYAYRDTDDSVCGFRDEVVLKAGEAPYVLTGSGTRNRWGDFSSTVVDPNETDLWTVQEYAESPANTWGTWWGMVEPQPPTDSYGMLRVTTNAPSQILVDGIPRDTWGLNWVKLPPGEYTVSFTDVGGFSTPTSRLVTVTEGVTTETAGAFVVRGWLRVTTSPPVPSTISVDGVPRNDWGIWTDLPVGDYEVCFGDVEGFTTPECQLATLTAGNTTIVTGTFE